MTIYTGEECLVFSYDIGHVSSSVSVTHLQFGKLPCTVSQYPGSTTGSLNVRFPSVVAYDEQDEPVAFGFEALALARQQQLDGGSSSDVIIADQFKAQLGATTTPPKESKSNASRASADGLPAFPNLSNGTKSSSAESLAVSLESSSDSRPRKLKKQSKAMTAFEGPQLRHVYADYLQHITACARAWWLDEQPSAQRKELGDLFDNKLWPTAVFVFAHPPSWSSKQKQVVREAFCSSKLLPYDFAPGRLHFVSEPASIAHFVKNHGSGQRDEWLVAGSSFVIVDAGDRATCMTGYQCDAVEPRLRLRTFDSSSGRDLEDVGLYKIVSAFKALLEKRLPRKWRQSNIDSLVIVFKDHVARKYAGHEGSVSLKMSTRNANDASAGIRDGQLALAKQDIEQLFRPVVEALLVRLASMIGRGDATAIVMVGALGENQYVQRRVREHFEARSIKLVTTDIPATSCISEGAAYMFTSETVLVRRTTRELGISTMIDWSLVLSTSQTLAKHQQRTAASNKGKARKDDDPNHWTKLISERPLFRSVVPGRSRLLTGRWTTLVESGTRFDRPSSNDAPRYDSPGSASTNQEYRKSFHFAFRLDQEEASTMLSIPIFAKQAGNETITEGSTAGIEWITDENGKVCEARYERVCVVQQDIRPLLARLEETRCRVGDGKRRYVMVDVDVIVQLGRESLEACIAYELEGTETRSKAVKIPRSVY